MIALQRALAQLQEILINMMMNILHLLISYLVSLLPSRRNLAHIVNIFRRQSLRLGFNNKHSTPIMLIIL